MILYAIIFFAVTAAGGLIMATKVLNGKTASWTQSILHAILGAAGLIIVLLTVLSKEALDLLSVSLSLLMISALAGFYLASKHLSRQRPSKGLVMIHSGVAMFGVLSLLIAYFLP